MGVAVLALFVALGTASAYATSHYLLHSKRQIKPSLLKSLEGKVGATGASGLAGATGPSGPGGPLLTTLPSGDSETGAFMVGGTAAGAQTAAAGSISFPTALASAPTVSVIGVVGASTTDCPGTPQAPAAARGYLCVYEGVAAHDGGGFDVFDTRGEAIADTAGPDGAAVEAYSDSSYTGNFVVNGTWAVTAP